MRSARLLMLAACVCASAACTDSPKQPTAPVANAASPRPDSAEAANERLRRRYECLNQRGYTFTQQRPGGGWGGPIGPANEPFDVSKRRFDEAVAACDWRAPVPRPS